MNYKDIDGNPTPWKAKHRSYWQRLLRKLYIEYVTDPYIQKGTKIEFIKELQKGNKFYGENKAIKLINDGDTANEVFVFRQMFPNQEEWTV